MSATIRFGAVVNANMTPKEVVDTVDATLGAYVAHGNGYVVIKANSKAARNRLKATEAPETNVEAPTPDADDSEAY